MMGVVLFLLATGHQTLLASMAVPGMSSLSDQPALDEEEAYLAEVSCIVVQLQELGVTSSGKLGIEFGSTPGRMKEPR